MTKQELRRRIRTEKGLHDNCSSQSILDALRRHPRIVAAKTLLLYSALPDEVQTQPLLDELVSQGKTVLLPRVVSDTDMELRHYHSREDLVSGAFGIMEPVGALFDDFSHIDMAVIPGMAFDRQGHRLGRGRGYYDRFLARIPFTYKIGVCFPYQLVDEVPTNADDVSMDEIVSGL